jgi:hypothetical protein
MTPLLRSLRRAALSALSVSLIGAAATAPAYALDKYAAPSQNFDLSQWKLTMPSGAEISPAELNSGFQYADVFYTDRRTGGMVFRCPNIAGTTTNSKYSRTELREMLDPANTSAKADSNNWTPEQGGWLRAKLRVDHVSTTGESKKVGRVIVGQIHGPETEPVRLYYSKKPYEKTGRIHAAMETASGSTWWSPDIVGNADDAGIALGENFTYQIKLYGRKLTVAIYRPDGRKYSMTRYIDPAYLGQNMYFKAGVYNQNNSGDVSDYAQATFFILEHTH